MTLLRLKKNWAFKVYRTGWLHPVHGPQTWPWWRMVSFSIVRLSPVQPPSIGYALWLYTRWGGMAWDFFVDRRTLPDAKAA